MMLPQLVHCVIQPRCRHANASSPSLSLCKLQHNTISALLTMSHCSTTWPKLEVVLALRTSTSVAKLLNVGCFNIDSSGNTRLGITRLSLRHLVLKDHIRRSCLMDTRRRGSDCRNVVLDPLLNIGQPHNCSSVHNGRLQDVVEYMLTMFSLTSKINCLRPRFPTMQWFLGPRLVPARLGEQQHLAIEWPSSNSTVCCSAVLADREPS